MTFADQYANHAYADLIREAETQGIGLGAKAERERIIALLEEELCERNYNLADCAHCEVIEDLIALIKGDNK